MERRQFKMMGNNFKLRSVLILFVVLNVFLLANFVSAATYDATGEWNLSILNGWTDGGDNCPLEVDKTESITITQNGDSGTLVIHGSEGDITFNSSVNGSNYNLSEFWIEDDGNEVTVSGTFTLSSSTSGTGQIDISVTEGAITCNKGMDIILIKQSKETMSLVPVNYLLLQDWSCKDDNETTGVYRVCNYFPLTLGNQWIYTTGDRTIQGPKQTCSTGYSGVRYGTTTYEYEGIWQNEKNGLMTPGCQYERPSGDFSDFGERILLIKPEMKIGEIVNSQHPNLGWSFSTTLIGFEFITVPTGTYNALKFEIVTNHTDGSCSYKTTLWLAKNIGPVKIHRTDANPADCLGCMFVCRPDNDLILLNTPAELTSFSVSD